MDEIKNNPRDAFTITKEKGWDPARLTPAQNRWIATELRSRKQLIKDGAKAVSSLVATTLKLRIVSDERAASNEQKCRSGKCGKFAIMTNDDPVCMACNCSSAFLRSKWKDATSRCPLVDPETKDHYWDNTTAPSTTGTVMMPSGGDYNAQGAGQPQ